ncbi:unnamed protein product [Brachionus calyciflorus]|uniref:Nuclear pore complex protein Nup85 n=1 Tax=Brachionus calyciflorus TaxID=104777 RepID=A0A813V5Z0_9BILA|nr:unnamed protein product [Brachionus calyciflorus]
MNQIPELQNYKIFNDPSWRRVISQFREIFNDLHLNLEKNSIQETIKPENVNLSDLCSEANQKYINIIDNELKLIDSKSENQEHFRLLLKVWKLCQIIFIKSSPSGILLNDLQEWYRSTNNIDPMIQDLFSNYNHNVDNLHTDQNYWLLIIMAVAQGRIDTARHLMSFHPSKNSPVFRSMDEILRTMPNFSSNSHLTLFEFKAKWEYWQKRCIQILTNENFQIEETGSLEIICKLLCADENTFLELKPIFNSWYYMLISYLSYANPSFNISDLHIHLDSGICMKVFENELDEFDAIILKIFDFDVDVIVNDCVRLFSNNFFSAHLLDILFLNGKLQMNKNDLTMFKSDKNSIAIHEEHLIEYAVQILSAAWSNSSLSLNQTAFDYLLKCSNLDRTGLELIETYLEKISLTNLSESNANKVFYLAFQNGLHDLAFSIGRVMQMRAFKRGMYGTALSWNVRIKDCSFGNYLAEKIIEDFFKSKDLKLLELTESLTKEIIYCDRLIFLSKYREFYKLAYYSNKTDMSTKLDNFKQAGTLLLQLLEVQNLIPFKFRKRVLFHIPDLIQENVFNEDQLFAILRIIQNYENKKDFLTKNELKNEQDEIEIDNDDVSEEMKWKFFYEKISQMIAENFVKNKIEL